MSRENRIKVLIVDDSAIVRKVLTEALSAEAGHRSGGYCPRSFRRAR